MVVYSSWSEKGILNWTTHQIINKTHPWWGRGYSVSSGNNLSIHPSNLHPSQKTWRWWGWWGTWTKAKKKKRNPLNHRSGTHFFFDNVSFYFLFPLFFSFYPFPPLHSHVTSIKKKKVAWPTIQYIHWYRHYTHKHTSIHTYNLSYTSLHVYRCHRWQGRRKKSLGIKPHIPFFFLPHPLALSLLQ